VSDRRLSKYTYGAGQTAVVEATGEPPGRCAQFERIKRLPETCVCEPAGGQDCTPPAGGFACVASGYAVR
jgi:hypothetical protein